MYLLGIIDIVESMPSGVADARNQQGALALHFAFGFIV